MIGGADEAPQANAEADGASECAVCMSNPIGIPCTWCGSSAPSHQTHGCGHVHCPFTRIDLTSFINAADISAADFPHVVVEKLQKAIDAALESK